MAMGDKSSMNPSTPTLESDEAADKALKAISCMDTLEQFSLFATVIQLYKNGGLTQLELQKLQNIYVTELERTTLLVTNIIPSKGQYKGMQMLRIALEETEQHAILNKLDKVYKDTMDALHTRQHDTDQPHLKTASQNDSVAAPSCTGSSSRLVSCTPDKLSYADKDGVNRDDHSDSTTAMARNAGTTTSSNDDNNGNNKNDASAITVHVAEQKYKKQQQPPHTIEINIQVHTSDSAHLATIPETSFRQRSSHFSFNTRPEGDVKLGSLSSVNEIECNSLTLKFVIVGDSSTGKTSLLYRYTTGKFSIAYEPTTLLDFHTVEVECRNTKYKLHLWDTAGQERFKAVTKVYYRGAVGAFVVYDVTDERSLENSLQWKAEVDNVARLVNDDPIPVVLLANKVDQGKYDGEQFSKDHGFAGYFETSAKTGQGIREAVRFMVKKVHKLSYIHKEPVVPTFNRDRSTSIKLEFRRHSLTSNEKEKKCCLTT